jgi:hypothetical protein
MMRRHRRRNVLGGYGVAGLVAVLTVTVLAPGAEGSEASSRPDIAGDWFGRTAATVAAANQPVVPDRAWAIAWTSAEAALGAGTGHPLPSRQRPHFDDAAVATAVHDVLVALVPDQKTTLDAALVASLAAVPDGDGEQAGIRAGQEAADRTLRERTGDGLDLASINRPFTPPPEAPGVYRLPPGATATMGAGLGQARTFLLGPADRFRPAAPPAPGTRRYRQDLRELQRIGGATSAERTQQQTDIALLWAQGPLTSYTAALRPLVQDPGRPLAWKVRLLATFTTATIDTQIAVSEAKFTYLRWRPVTAIRAADTDGDPLTRPDPNWISLVQTPAGPEYPSAHAAYAGAAERVLEKFAGPRTPAPFAVTRTLQDGRVVSREYRRGTPWTALTQDNVDARVWGGVHFRFSDETGAMLGRRVADYDVQQVTRPTSG